MNYNVEQMTRVQQ